ncbi:unnamed protein product [Amaranthus hypochondriacus]
MLHQYRISSIDWRPSAVVSLATSVDESQVAAAREDGSLEIWLVSPGSVGWHCQLTIPGDPNSRITGLVWCRTRSKDSPSGRLFSSSIDGSVSEWDLYTMKQKVVLETVGVSIWQMALEPSKRRKEDIEPEALSNGNGVVIDNVSVDSDSSDDDDSDDMVELYTQSSVEDRRLALACDDGCVRLYNITDGDELTYHKSLPRVSGRALSVIWSLDGNLIFSGSSDGYIRCWDTKRLQELYRITVGLGGLGTGSDLCVWSLLALRGEELVSADSTGSVQFWDIKHGTLLQAHSLHKGDAYALAASPSHNRVFSAGSDGKVILYKLSEDAPDSSANGKLSSEVRKRWVFVDSKSAHTHDVRALTVAVPICQEGSLLHDKVKKVRRKGKPVDFSYHKWANMGVPMLLSAGDDTRIFAYSANEFTKFSPHDVCPAPQRVPVHFVQSSAFNKMPLLLVQSSNGVDIMSLKLGNGAALDKAPGGPATTNLLVRVNKKGSGKITCCTISPCGSLFCFSNHVKPSMFELKRTEGSKTTWLVNKRHLPGKLPYAHALCFTTDSSQLIIAGGDRRIYIVDLASSDIVHIFTPSRKTQDEYSPPSEPPITKLFTSFDGQWLAAVNCFGDIYVFNMEIYRQHWFISRLDGASVTAGGFSPHSNNVLVVTTSSNQVYAFDVEAKQLGEWSRKNSFSLPRTFQEFPGEVIGVSFPPSASSSMVVYSSRAMCLIDFEIPVERDDSNSDLVPIEMLNSLDSVSKKLNSNGRLKRKLQQTDMYIKLYGRRNFEFFEFRHPVLFVSHASKSSLLVVDKPWLEVVKSLNSQPIHRHIYGN